MSDQIAGPTPRMLILSGPAGAGKTTIVKKLLEAAPVSLEMSVSATTRAPRPNEVDGRDYYFLTREEFERRRAADEFIEWAEVHRSGHLYGTLKSEIQRIQQQKKWVLLEIDVEGAQNVMRLFPAALSVFLQTASMDEYERRLRDRGTETEEVILRRLRTAREELQYVASYKHRVINDDLERAVGEVRQLLASREAELNAG
ncbi:guanylate kinase [Planctomicrobium piriforme]|uniref:Guanylate kinase n=1 Tax=Planctomicrobium piriforme TaxID=1576369 RepID=A0A1I3IFT6_9PLAN|nr:guanylate kinase [Planctomicrobium piriforme]SFI46663.1 guanylate kinase [Planctomicrobium piriforme]